MAKRASRPFKVGQFVSVLPKFFTTSLARDHVTQAKECNRFEIMHTDAYNLNLQFEKETWWVARKHCRHYFVSTPIIIITRKPIVSEREHKEVSGV